MKPQHVVLLTDPPTEDSPDRLDRLVGLVLNGELLEPVCEIDVDAEPNVTIVYARLNIFPRTLRMMPRAEWERLQLVKSLNLSGSKP